MPLNNYELMDCPAEYSTFKKVFLPKVGRKRQIQKQCSIGAYLLAHMMTGHVLTLDS